VDKDTIKTACLLFGLNEYLTPPLSCGGPFNPEILLSYTFVHEDVCIYPNYKKRLLPLSSMGEVPQSEIDLLLLFMNDDNLCYSENLNVS